MLFRFETVKFAPHTGPPIHKHKEAPGITLDKKCHLMRCADSTNIHQEIYTQKVFLPSLSDPEISLWIPAGFWIRH